MNGFDVMIAACIVLTGCFVAGVAYVLLNRTWATKTVVGIFSHILLAVMTVPGVVGLCVWTDSAVRNPAPTEVTWENIDRDPNAGFWTRQAAWLSLKTGLIEPKVEKGFFYSTAEFGEGEDHVRLVYLPFDEDHKWKRF